MGVSKPEIDAYLSGLHPQQTAHIHDLRDLVVRGAPTLDEVVNTGAWLTGYLFCVTRDRQMVVAIGATRASSVTFHAMPGVKPPDVVCDGNRVIVDGAALSAGSWSVVTSGAFSGKAVSRDRPRTSRAR